MYSYTRRGPRVPHFSAFHCSYVAIDPQQPTEFTTSASAVTASSYENEQLPPSATEKDRMYEEVELKPITRQEKEIEVAPNDAYGTVQR